MRTASLTRSMGATETSPDNLIPVFGLRFTPKDLEVAAETLDDELDRAVGELSDLLAASACGA